MCVLPMVLVHDRQVVAQQRCKRPRPHVAQAGHFFADEHPAVNGQLKQISHGFAQRCHHQARVLRHQLFNRDDGSRITTHDALAGRFSKQVPLRWQVGRFGQVGADPNLTAKASFRECDGDATIGEIAGGLEEAPIGELGQQAMQACFDCKIQAGRRAPQRAKDFAGIL